MMITSKWVFGPQSLGEVNAIRNNAHSQSGGTAYRDEMDDHDPVALHVLIGEDDEWLATGRLFDDHGRMKMGPIFIAPEVSNRGVDDLLARMLINKAFELLCDEVVTDAKEGELAFYNGLNFTACGEAFEKDGQTYTPMKVTKDRSPIPTGCADCSKCSGCHPS